VQGGGVDFASAYRHFSSAAQQSNPSAQYGLAYMYLTGQGASEDHEKAFKLFTQVRVWRVINHAGAHSCSHRCVCGVC